MKISLFVIFYLISNLALAQQQVEQVPLQLKMSQTLDAWPNNPTNVTMSPLPYIAVKYLSWDSEKFIKKNLGLTSQSCSYLSKVSNAVFSHKEIGACAYHLFLDSYKTQEKKQNPIFIWAKNSKNQTIQLQMDWRPYTGSLYKVLSLYIEMRYEKEIHQLRSRFFNFFRLDIDRLPYGSSQALVGDIYFTFRQDEEVLRNLKNVYPDLVANLPAAVANLAPDVRRLDVQVTPAGRKNGYLQNNMSIKVLTPESDKTVYMQIKTNVNFLDTERLFNVSGKITGSDPNSTSDRIP